MALVIREVALGDAPSIHALNRDGFGYCFDPDATRQRLSAILAAPANRLFAADLDGVVEGYIHAADYDCSYAHPMKNILALVVDESSRGRGIGRALLAAAEDWARECGCCGVRLVSGFNRQEAHLFYKACGYHHRKDQKNFTKHFAQKDA